MTEITACPECDSPEIHRRQPSKPSSPAPAPGSWTCDACGAHFEDPVERPRRDASGPCGLAGELAAADSIAEVVGDD